jgi:xanthine dioxygenase
MFLKSSPASSVKVIEDVAKIREILARWQRRILRPEYIFIAPVEEGDIGMWDNWVSFKTSRF